MANSSFVGEWQYQGLKSHIVEEQKIGMLDKRNAIGNYRKLESVRGAIINYNRTIGRFQYRLLKLFCFIVLANAIIGGPYQQEE